MDASGSSSNGASTPDRRAQPRRQDQEQQEDRIQDRGSQPQQRDHQQDHQQAQLARTSSRRDGQPTRHRRRQSRNSSTPSSPDSTTAASSGTTLTQTSRSQSLDLEASGHRRSQACIPRRWRRLSPSASPFSLPPELCGPLLQLPLDLCAALRRGGERGNVLLSPHYAACILVMMHHGAAGNTRHQLGHLLGFPEDDGPPRDTIADASCCGGASGVRRGSYLETFGLHACRLFCSDFHRPRQKLGSAGSMTGYLALFHDASVRLSARYHRPLVMLSPQIHARDFAACSEQCRQSMDGLFRALSGFAFDSPVFTSECVGPSSLLVFASLAVLETHLPALYRTCRRAFREASGTTRLVNTMRRMGAPYRWARCVDIGATVLEVPFESPLVESMLVFLPDPTTPDEPDGLASLERSLSREKILDCLARLEHRGPVDVTLPRLRLRCATDLAHIMPAMGAPDAFGEAADFSNMGNVASNESSDGTSAGMATEEC
ncbi:hypothetical protein V5799_008062 [Amblyomma americanum]|uniref:Serpin domain-containing protein n=1 Tax=Amblyomma americanum TaxID=6943 RepID=A0AAQ4FF67_AMBAM